MLTFEEELGTPVPRCMLRGDTPLVMGFSNSFFLHSCSLLPNLYTYTSSKQKNKQTLGILRESKPTSDFS